MVPQEVEEISYPIDRDGCALYKSVCSLLRCDSELQFYRLMLGQLNVYCGCVMTHLNIMSTSCS